MSKNPCDVPLVCVVDDCPDVRDSLDALLRSAGYRVKTFAGAPEFLASEAPDSAACLVLDVQLGHANGLDFQQELLEIDVRVPVILISGHGDIPMTVRGMRAGAVTFLSKPFLEEEMLTAVNDALERHAVQRLRHEEAASLRHRFASLTPRERDVLGLVTAGLMNKQVAARLCLSEITVKIHRGNLMRKMQAQSLADLVRMAESLGARADASRFGR